MTATFNAFGLIVADMSASLAFYRGLGLDIPASADKEPHVEVALPGGTRLMFDTTETINSFDPDWKAPTGSARTSMAFECDSPADVDAVHTAMTAAGHAGHLAPFDAPWGQRYATLADPDGNGVDLYARLG